MKNEPNYDTYDNSIRARVLMYINFKFLTVKQFAKQCGIEQASIYSLDDNTPHMIMERIYLAFPMLNPFWVLTGEGEMERVYETRDTHRINYLESENIRLSELINIRDGQISRLVAMLENKDKIIVELTEKLFRCNGSLG